MIGLRALHSLPLSNPTEMMCYVRKAWVKKAFHEMP